jgi:archaellum biogenesis ATPase FlaH
MNIADKLLKLKDYTGEDEVLTSTEMKVMVDDEPHREWFRSNVPTLDMKIEGFEAGELIAISGPRKSGKTLFCQSLTKTFQEQELASLWFSYELTPKQFFRAFGEGELPVFLMPKKNKAHDLVWLKDRILESIAKYGTSVVFIDHLHFLFDLAKVRNSSLEIGQVIRFLKSLAIELNITIFILCHMKKLQFDTEPTDTDFRDSSFVASESDTGLIIWRVKDSDNKAWLKICYSRRTGAWEKKIPLIKTGGLLKEADLNGDHA